MAQSGTQSRRSDLARFWPVALVLVTGLGLTLIVVNVLRDTARRHDEQRFEAMTKGVMEMIDTRFELFAQALTGLRDLFALRDTVDDRLWLNYVEAMQPAVHFRGLHELGFAERVFAPDDRLVNYLRTNSAPASSHLQPRLEGHLKRLRASAGTSYSIRPLEPDFCPYAFPVTRCWRVDGAIEAAKQRLGENLYLGTDPDEAMPWTIGTFLPAATKALDLRTGQGSRRGVRLLLSVTRPDMPSRGEHESGRQLIPGLATLIKPGWRLQFRRQDCYSKGVVYFTVEMESFLRSTLVGRSPEIAFALYQGTNRTPAEYLHGVTLADYTARSGSPYLTRTDRLRLYGQKLTFDFYTLPSFETRSLRVWPRVGGTVGSVLTLLVAWGVWINTRARLRQEAISADLRESRDRLQVALQARDRLNRDLHDTVIQSIYAVGLGLQSARRILGKDPERTSGRMTGLMADLNSIIARLRGYIHGAPEHSVSSLAGLLEETLAPFRRETTATVSLRIDTAAEGWRLDPPTILEVASIVREAVSNSVRHADATTINVRVGVAEERLSVAIEDDGEGFDQTTQPVSGHGLSNIRARVAEMNGTVIFESAPGRGTAVRFLLPVSNHTSDSIPE